MYCYGYKLIWKPGRCLFVGYFFLTRPIISHKMSQRTCTATAINWSESQVAVCLLVIFFWPVPLLVTKCHKERTEWLITSSGAVFGCTIFSHEKTHHVLVQTYGFANFASGLMWIGARRFEQSSCLALEFRPRLFQKGTDPQRPGFGGFRRPTCEVKKEKNILW